MNNACNTFRRQITPVAPGSSQEEHLLGSFFLVKSQSLALYFLLTHNWAEELIVTLAGLPDQGLIKEAQCKT